MIAAKDGVQDIDPKLKTYLNGYMTWLRDPALGGGLSGWRFLNGADEECYLLDLDRSVAQIDAPLFKLPSAKIDFLLQR